MGLDIRVIKPIKINRKLKKLYKKGENYRKINFLSIDNYFEGNFPNDNEWIKNIKPFIKRVKVKFYNIYSMKKSLGIPKSEFDSWEISSEGYGGFTFRNITSGKELNYRVYTEREWNKIPLKTDYMNIIAYRTIGYQRKGANSRFYNEDKWPSLVWSEDELNNYRDKYFSGNIPGEEPGFAEYNLTDEEMSSRFKENIIDKFFNGCIVLFD